MDYLHDRGLDRLLNDINSYPERESIEIMDMKDVVDNATKMATTEIFGRNERINMGFKMTTQENISRKVEVKELDPGDTFITEETATTLRDGDYESDCVDVFIVIDTPPLRRSFKAPGDYAAINISSGEMSWFDESDKVIEVQVEYSLKF